jgi:uncharacterized protein YwgA
MVDATHESLMNLDAVLTRMASETGLSYDPVDFARRLRIQKTVYLLQALGYSPTTRYSFSQYVRGPYSPTLARDYYALRERGLGKARPADIPARYLRPVTEAVMRGNAFMEATATLHLHATRNRDSSRTQIFDHVSWVKPELKPHLKGAWGFLRANKLVTRRT